MISIDSPSELSHLCGLKDGNAARGAWPDVEQARSCNRYDRQEPDGRSTRRSKRSCEHLLSFPKPRCRLYLVTFGFAAAIRPMRATFPAEYKKSGGFE